MDHHPAGPHPPGHPAGGQDVAGGFLLAVRVGVGGVYKVRGMKGQDDPRLGGLFADGPGGGLPHGDAFAALVLIGVQALPLQPQGHVLGGLEPFRLEPVRVAGGAEHRPHRASPLFPWMRKGVSMPYRRARKMVPNWMGFTMRVRTPALLPPQMSVKI